MTRLPRRRSPWKQMQLILDVQQRHSSYWTTRIGDFFEEASARLFKGYRYHTDSECDYCPDIGFSPTRFAETKASGRGGRIIIYEQRLRRELKWVKANGASIEYHIWRHRAYTRECGTEAELNSLLAKTTTQVIRLDLETLRDILAEIPSKVINKWNQTNGCKGWLLPITTILAKAEKVATRKSLTVMGKRIRGLDIYSIPTPDPF